MASIARSVSFRAFSTIRCSSRAQVITAKVSRRAFSVSAKVSVTKFTKDHEWISHGSETTGIATIGITAYAANALGDVVFVELPEVGTEVAAGETFGAVESVKSASDIMSPVSGEIVEANDELKGKPSLINKSPEADGWIAKIKISDAAELDELLGAEEYKAFTKGGDGH